jgi:hypothetical protein
MNLSKARRALMLVLALLLIPGSAQAATVFEGGFETNNLSQWSLLQACDPSRATVYSATSQPTWPAPVSGNYALRFRVLNTDVSPCTPTSNPRAQVLSSKLLYEGQEYWQTFRVYFPSTYPSTSSWQLFQQDYGDPWNGSPPLGFEVYNLNGVDTMVLDRGRNHNYDKVWRKPLTRGKWYTFLVRKKMGKTDSTGFVELWVDGQQQTFMNGATRLYTNTMAADSTGPYQFFLNNYRAVNTASSSEIFFDGAKIGTLRSDVEGATTSPPPAESAPPGESPPPAEATVSAAFTYSPKNPVAGKTTVAFDGSASKGAVAYSWSLDGYTYLTGVKPKFKFQNPGTKRVTLTVTGANGSKASVAQNVVVVR